MSIVNNEQHETATTAQNSGFIRLRGAADRVLFVIGGRLTGAGGEDGEQLPV